MNKIWKIMQKNFRLLFRTKSSKMVIVLGPLLIILIASLAFNSPNESTFNVGTFTPKQSELVNSFNDKLSDGELNVIEYDVLDKCIEDVKKGYISVCLQYPQEFQLSDDKSDEIQVFVDESKINVVYEIRNKISTSIDFTATELSEELAGKLLETISRTQSKIVDAQTLLEASVTESESILKEYEQIGPKIQTRFDVGSLDDADGITTSVQDLQGEANDMRGELLSIIDDYIDLLRDQDYNTEEEEQDADDLEDELYDLKGEYEKKEYDSVEEINELVDSIESDFSDVQKMFGDVEQTNADLVDRLNDLQERNSKVKNDIVTFNKLLDSINQDILSLPVTRSQSIVSPVSTKVTSVVSESKNVGYVFQYFLMMIIMLTTILYSSTITVMERKSNAHFRNFASPTKDMHFIFATYLTNVLLLFIQMIMVFIVAKLIFDIAIFNNLYLSVIGMLFVISIFTFIGMLVGFLLKSQEEATLLSILIGTLMLVVSNVILPIESMPVIVQKIVKLNPFMLGSETLKQAILFNSAFGLVIGKLFILLLYAIILFLLTYYVQQYKKVETFTKVSVATISDYIVKRQVPVEKYLKIGSQIIIKNKEDMLNVLLHMKGRDFEKIVDIDKNPFIDWILEVYKDSKLAKQLRNKSRIGMIKILEDHLGLKNK